MKKIVLMVVAAMMATVGAQAQEEWKHEVAVSYGGGSNTDIISTIGAGIFAGSQTDYWGPVGVEYFYNVLPQLGIGSVFTIGGCKWDGSDNPSSTYFSVLPSVKFNYVNKKHFGMYVKLAAGITFAKHSDDKDSASESCFNWQASLLGIEFGGAFRGFVELGCGEQGIAVAGLRYKF